MTVSFHSPSEVYHVAVMPCFDKKLEASRNDFYNDLYRTRDVDCVITSGTHVPCFIACVGFFIHIEGFFCRGLTLLV